MKKIVDDLVNPPKEQEASGMAVLYNLIFNIARVSVSTATSARNHHYHNAYELYYLMSGGRYYFIKDKTYHVKPGSFVLVKPYDIHSTGNLHQGGYDRILITFKKSFFDSILSMIKGVNLFECYEKDIHIIKLTPKEQNFIETLLLAMLDEHEKRLPGSEHFLKTAMVQLLLLINRYSGQLPEDANCYPNAIHKTVSEVAAYINNNYFENVTLEEVSRQFFISPCYFSRTFRQVTGVAFTEYINGVRVKEAQRLLVKTDMSVSDIAERIGYKSATHFGRTFKMITGQTPLAYRRKHKQVRNEAIRP